jgi:hypothetical protein
MPVLTSQKVFSAMSKVPASGKFPNFAYLNNRSTKQSTFLPVEGGILEPQYIAMDSWQVLYQVLGVYGF